MRLKYFEKTSMLKRIVRRLNKLEVYVKAGGEVSDCTENTILEDIKMISEIEIVKDCVDILYDSAKGITKAGYSGIEKGIEKMFSDVPRKRLHPVRHYSRFNF